MWVVKLGGSLASHPALLRRWLEVLSASGPAKVVIVPGGGPFADQVREAQAALGFSDATAHRMAILAMEQFALVLAGLAPKLTPAESVEQIRQVLRSGGVAVWLPAAMTIGNPEIPETWDVTSDSLAAWLARRLDTQRLVLVKSCPMPEGNATPEELQQLGIVDTALLDFMRGAGFPVHALSKEDHPTMRAWLMDSRLVEQSLGGPE